MYLLALVNSPTVDVTQNSSTFKNPKDPQPHYIILPKPEQLFRRHIAQSPPSLRLHRSSKYPTILLVSRPPPRSPSIAVPITSFSKQNPPPSLAPSRIRIA
ncbi:hypothetical protein H0G86_012512 [Trichoderma simmonsii]|uniref:Uncharacterized protein n=1 Tax=Trichoderma simmonsii TaxID=1491479 RepID=A0A8G0LNN3_9HYPO|nr:hypothetical protein H0G86_012512 [Trichoderma simmonsii]